MVAIFGPLDVLRVAFSLAALLFGIILYILICTLGNEQVHKNLTFRSLVLSVVLGDLFLICDNLIRKSELFDIPAPVCILMVMIGYQANIFLTYFMSKYVMSFFDDDEFRHRSLFEQRR